MLRWWTLACYAFITQHCKYGLNNRKTVGVYRLIKRSSESKCILGEVEQNENHVFHGAHSQGHCD